MDHKNAFVCTKHLSGVLAEELFSLFVKKKWVSHEQETFVITEEGKNALTDLGIDLSLIYNSKQKESCAFSERENGNQHLHLGAHLGQVVFEFLVKKGYLLHGEAKDYCLSQEGFEFLHSLGIRIEES